MAIAGTLEIQLAANLARLSGDMQKAQTTVGRAMGSVEKSVNLAKRALGALGLGLGAVAFTRLVKDALDAQDQLLKLSQRLGITVEGLVGLRHAADLSGVSAQTLDMAMQRFGRRAAEAAQGTGEAEAALKELGIQLLDGSGRLKSSEVMLGEVADAMQGVTSSSDRVRLAMKLFDSEGVRMLNMLDKGKAGLAAMVAEGQALNPVTEESARQAELFNDSMEKLSKSVTAVGTKLLNDLLPTLSKVADTFAEATLKGDGFWKTVFGFATTTQADRAAPWKAIAEVEETIQRQREQLKAHEESFLPMFFADDIALLKTAIAGNETRLNFLKALRRQESGQTDPGFIAQGGPVGTGRRALTPEEIAAAKAREKLLDAQAQAHAERLVERIERTREVYAEELNLEETLTLATETERDKRIEALQERLARERELKQEGAQFDFDLMRERVAAEQAAEQTIQSMKIGTWQLGVGLLQEFAGESKAAAIAVIAINKALAVAQVIVNTQAAIARGYAELGPYAGAVNHARMQALMGLQVGVIAATGLVQAANVGGGGAALGSPANPVNVTPGIGSDAGSFREQPRGQTTIINLSGETYSRKQVRGLLETMNENSGDGSRVVVVEQ